MEAFFAYRLPSSKNIIYYSGKSERITDLNNLKSECILLHDFLGEQIYVISELKEISSSDFTIQSESNPSRPFTKADYLKSFNKVKSKIDNGLADKVVLSRIEAESCGLDAMGIFHRLNEKYTKSFNYIVSSPSLGVWVGASPELLLESTGNLIKSVALAGTKNTYEEWSEKEYREQKFVFDYIKNAFKQNKVQAIQAASRETINAGKVQHLMTPISGIKSEGFDLVNILQALHPTPAVCGTPKETAMEIIIDAEPHARDFYTGYIGVLTEESQKFFVNLRCLKWFKKSVDLYLGGGIVEGSILENEWIETERKAETLMSVIK